MTFCTVATASAHRSTLLLSTPRSQSDALNACATLGESLLPVNKPLFANDLVPLLRYQTFLKNFPQTQQFWVANEGRVCQMVNANGVVTSSLTCLRSLPALCSQSAALRAPAQPQTSLTVRSGDLEITGYAHLHTPTGIRRVVLTLVNIASVIRHHSDSSGSRSQTHPPGSRTQRRTLGTRPSTHARSAHNASKLEVRWAVKTVFSSTYGLPSFRLRIRALR